MTGRMDFGFTFGAPGAGVSAQARREGPFRIVVLADFSGHGFRGLVNPKPLVQRLPQSVDIDNFDAVMRRMAPALSLTLNEGGASPLALSFGSIDDFHPDQLLGRLPEPIVSAAAAGQAPAPRASAAAQSAPSRESDASALERLLGRKPEAAKANAGLDALIQSIVAPSLAPAADPAQAQSKAKRDAARGEQMRAVLHHPAFQSLEAAWRGVQGLVRSLELNEDLQLYLLDVSQAELQADAEAAQGDVGKSALARVLMKPQDDADEPPSWPLVIGLQAFGPSATDLSLLSTLGAVAQRVGGDFMASATPAVLGLDSFGGAADAADWPGMAADAQARWDGFRRSPQAASVHLAAPRVLLRLPYGQATDAIDSCPFEEMASGFEHESCLWGSGALACAQLVGQSFMDQGWAMRLGDQLDLGDLPAYVLERDGEKRLLPCAEANLSEGVGERLLALGLMPLLSYKHRNAVRVMGLRAMA